MNSTTIDPQERDPDELPGISLDEWIAGLDPAAHFLEATDKVIVTPAGQMDAALLLSDPCLEELRHGNHYKPARDPLSQIHAFAWRLIDLYAEDARVIEKD